MEFGAQKKGGCGMVIVIKPFFYWDEGTRSFLNFRGKTGTVKYSNIKGSMVSFDNGVEAFIPKDALKKI